VFDTRPVTIAQGLLVIAVGIAGFAVIEVEKWLRQRLAWVHR
jgi:hypothetical protein